jgi:hypothetical protein
MKGACPEAFQLFTESVAPPPFGDTPPATTALAAETPLESTLTTVCVSGNEGLLVSGCVSPFGPPVALLPAVALAGVA